MKYFLFAIIIVNKLESNNRDEFVTDGYKVWKAEDFNSEESFPIKREERVEINETTGSKRKT